MNAEFKISLAPVSDDKAEGAAKQIFDKTRGQMGFVPNMYRTMANSDGYFSTYAHGYTAFREHSGFSAKEQEIVFLVISRENGCDYCTAAHSMIADKVSKLDPNTLAAVRAGEALPDIKFQALAEFTSRIFQARGLVTKAESAVFLGVGYQERQIMEIILAISVKTLSNYSNHVFHTELDPVFAPYAIENEPALDLLEIA